MLPFAPQTGRFQRGFTLVELLLIIVVLGIAAGTLTVVSTRSGEMSASLLREQQAMALGNAILDEVRAMPFTFCDPTDANATTATSTAGCANPALAETAMAPESGEIRSPPAPGVKPFNNVNDYNGWSALAGTLRDAGGNLITADLPTVANCNVGVGVAPQAVAGVAAGAALRITVTVSCPGLISPYVVDAIRIRYAPQRSTF